MRIYFDGEILPDEHFLELINKAGKLCLEQENVPYDKAEVSVTFVDKDEIKSLNCDFRGKDAVTDVLSFPQFESPEDIPKDTVALLGDVVICQERAKEQAEEYGHSYERELIYLFVHSMMHLLGYDHIKDEEKAEMRKAEEGVLFKMGITRGEDTDE